MSGWVIGSILTLATIDQSKNAQHQAAKQQAANEQIANAQLAQQESDALMQRQIADEQAAMAAQQAEEMTKRAEEAKATALENAKQGSSQRVAQTNLDNERTRAQELARQSQMDASTQAPDVMIATSEAADEPASRRRKRFSSASSAVRV